MEEIPEDMVAEILARVPYKFHHHLKLVCKSWDSIVKRAQFYQERMKRGFCQEFICSVETRFYDENRDADNVVKIYDPVEKEWKLLRPMPDLYEFSDISRCVVVNNELVLLGVTRRDIAWCTQKRGTVLIFNFSNSTWRKGADMYTFPYSFACAARGEEGEVYIAGGDLKGPVGKAYVYNVAEDRWRRLP
ncbi:hypothetical protein KI387_000902, partial [Taxus chinensis]